MTVPFTTDVIDRDRFPVDPWRLVETGYSLSDLGETETNFAVANGYLGMRANPEEGRDAHSHGTYINGLHETWSIQHAEEAFGFAKLGQSVVNVPDAKLIKLYVDDEPLLLSVASLFEYERAIDFRTGVLTRDILWRTPAGKRVRVRSTRMASFTQRHLAVMTFEVTLLDDSAPVTLSSQVLNRQDGQDEYHVQSAALGEGFDPRRPQATNERVLEPRLKTADGPRALLGFRCQQSRMTLACGFHHDLQTDNEYRERTTADDDVAKTVYTIDAKPGQTITLTKFVTYHSSRGVPARELADRCHRTLDRAVDSGAEQLLTEQTEWLTDYWNRSDAEIHGQPELQQALRWNLFQLAQASGRAEGGGVAAKGVTGNGYSGHYFWDTEVYVIPFLSYTCPQMARSLLHFRYTMLSKARDRAAELSQVGALYPWRTISGEEASAYYAAGTAQYHINADIVHALDQYVNATGDQELLRSEGCEVLAETARLWEDLGFWRTNGDGTYHIYGVTGPDEYTTVVNDNLYTNVMARFNLYRAADAIEELARTDPSAYEYLARRINLHVEEPAAWRQAADRMFLPYAESLGIHPQDAQFLECEVWDLTKDPERRPLLLHYHPLVIYRFQVIKQADVVLAMFLQGDQFTDDEKRRNFEYYDPITTGDSSLSACVQAIIAAEVGYDQAALDYFVDAVYTDLADLHKNTVDGVHVASAAGVWGALVHGFAGLSDHGGLLKFEPRLPQSWDGITFRITVRGCRLRATVNHSSISLVVEEGDDPIRLMVSGATYDISSEPITVPLANQGPRLGGKPGLGPDSGWTRSDGTTGASSAPPPSATRG